MVASAGSGKTTYLVDKALSDSGKRVAVVTYTNNNLAVIKRTLCEKAGVSPARIDVRTWFEFLLHECARPYQRSVYEDKRIRTVYFPEGRSAPYARKDDVARFYFRNGEEVYSDKISKFVMECERKSAGRVTRRLSEMYDAVFVDETQDLAGYDFDLLEVVMQAGIPMVLVGDPRQGTYRTNESARNRRYCGSGFLDKAKEWEASGLCVVEKQARSYRCNQTICDFADKLYPDFEKTSSLNDKVTGHDGVFMVASEHLDLYNRRYSPQLLRYNRTADTHGHSAVNFGNAKGMTFDRVLIVPHGPIKKYLLSGDLSTVEGSLAKFYVAVTRARHSVAFLYDGKCCGGYPACEPA